MKLTELERKILLRALDEWEWQGSHDQLARAEDSNLPDCEGDQALFDTFEDYEALEQKLSKEDT